MGRLTSRRGPKRVARERVAEIDLTDVGSVLEAYEPEILTESGSHVSAWVAMTDHTTPRVVQHQDQDA